MPFIPPEQLARAREMDLLTYLRCCEPEELVSAGGNTYAIETNTRVLSATAIRCCFWAAATSRNRWSSCQSCWVRKLSASGHGARRGAEVAPAPSTIS